MKKIFLLLINFCFLTSSFASFEIKPSSKKASEIFLSIGVSEQRISLMDLSVISVKDFQKASGRRFNFFDRLGFKAAQKKLKNSINCDGTINNTRLIKNMSKIDNSVGFNSVGFALGLLLNIIGVFIAYVVGGNKEVKRNRTKWAWIGLGLGLFLALTGLLLYSMGA